MHHLNEQEIERREKLQRLIDMGIEPYPAAEVAINTNSKIILETYTAGAVGFENVQIAGRLMSVRIMGKASFAVIKDSAGTIQVYIAQDEICTGDDKTWYNEVFKKLLDLGDFIFVSGPVFITKTGEISVKAKELRLLSKSVKPLPVVKTDAEGNVHDAFSDPELRFRQRYVDLIVNPGVKETFIARNKIISSIRNFCNGFGFMEMDTPVLQPIPGGAAARPFTTHHNALDIELYMRIANEL